MDPRLQTYSRRSDELSVEQNCLLWGTGVIRQQKLQSRVLADLHENHLGSNRMKALARSYNIYLVAEFGHDVGRIVQEMGNLPTSEE